jgi:RNA polymerase sigma factor (sigma-70 family)
MSARAITRVAARLQREPAPGAGATDRDLLARFLDAHDEAAFEALVRRHARLVRTAVARVLSDPTDAEDAVQATFLVLVRRAKAIDWRADLGPWLYGVAHRVAVKARDAGRARARKEKAAAPRPDAPEAHGDLSWREAVHLLHAELDRLPDRYRLPLLLCYLEGKSRDEAAGELNVTPGSIKGRLERGKELLRGRLARRGVTLSAGLLAAVTGPTAGGATSAARVAAILATARGAVPARVAAITRDTLAATVVSKVTRTIAGVVCLGVVVSALVAGTVPPGEGPTAKAQPPAPTAAPREPQTDGHDAKLPLQKGAVVAVLVKRPDGKRAANATVAVWADRTKQAAGRTNESGRIELALPASFPRVTAVATAAGFAPEWAEFEPGVGRETTTLALREPGPALAGRVTDLEGHPVANLPVVVERVGRPKPGGTIDDHLRLGTEHPSRWHTGLFDLDTVSAEEAGLPTRVTTDQDGKFTIAGVGADRSVRLTTRGDTSEHLQVRAVTRKLEAKQERPGPFGLQGTTFTLRVGPARAIEGTVTDAKTGAGVPGMKVAELIANICETTTGKDGKFKLTGVPKTVRYMFGIGSLGESPYFDANRIVDDPPGLGPVTVDFKVHRGLVATGRVSDSSGKPVAGHIFYYWRSDNPHVKDFPGLTDTQVALSNWGQLDRDGRYKLLVIPGGGAVGVCATPESAFARLNTQKELQARAVYAAPTAALHAVVVTNFDPKEPKSLVHDFTLKTGIARKLVIRGSGGKVPETLLAVGQSDDDRPQPVAGDTIPLAGLNANRARVVVLFDEAKTVGAVAAVTGEADTPVTATLETLGSLTGRVFDSGGDPAAGAEVRVWLVLDRAKHDNLPNEFVKTLGLAGIVPGAWDRFTGRTTKADKDGRFTLTGLLPGQKYRLRIGFDPENAGGEILQQRNELSVKPGEVHDLGELKPKK